jgi:hypothetical protein
VSIGRETTHRAHLDGDFKEVCQTQVSIRFYGFYDTTIQPSNCKPNSKIKGILIFEILHDDLAEFNG